MRYVFGGGVADWTFSTTGESVQSPEGYIGQPMLAVGGVLVTFWSEETGGVQYTDLLTIDGAPVSEVITADGGNGLPIGHLPPLYGPEDVPGMWAQAGDAPRVYIEGRLGPSVAHLATESAATAAQLAAHVSTVNPHSTSTRDLVDFADVEPTTGQVPVWDAAAGQYVPTEVQGLDPARFVGTAGGSTIEIPPGDTTTSALTIRLPAGDRSAAAPAVRVMVNVGTDGAPDWRLVTAFAGGGELRVTGVVASRVQARVQAAPGQTANIMEWANSSGTPLSWVDSAGRIRAANVAVTPSWAMDTAAVVAGTYRFYNPTGTALTLRGFVISAGGDVGAGGDMIINPKLDGVPVYSSANRPRLAEGARTSGLVTALSTTVWPAGSYLTVDVDAVPTTPPTKIHIQAVAY